MVFSSVVFLWVLLPVVLVSCYMMPSLKAKNIILILFSFLFYAWGGVRYVLLMLFSVLLNYVFGLIIGRWHKRRWLTLCIAINLLILGYFKYYNFLADSINHLSGGNQVMPVLQVVLPVGISFYTFQALSYVVDVYRGDSKPQKNLLNVMLYVSFFPQLIAGPIVKYHDIELQIDDRRVSWDGFSYGIKRFIFGMAKKVILANSFAKVVDEVFAYQISDVSTPLLWMTALLYMLQIYFDFSGYSDMAIGLGKMFGFTFQENFNFPYLSQSIREFWRRWHISLSSWFREYVYIPLGGNRKGTVRTYVNLGIVFFLTGLWHGAGWTFLLWGLYHGFFIILERCFLGEALDRLPWKLPRRIYTLAVVYIGWIFFRAETIGQALEFLQGMFVPHPAVMTMDRFMNNQLWVLLVVALLAGGVLQELLIRWKNWRLAADGEVNVASIAGYMSLLWLALLLLVNNTYNPFIYFRF